MPLGQCPDAVGVPPFIAVSCWWARTEVLSII